MHSLIKTNFFLGNTHIRKAILIMKRMVSEKMCMH